MTMSPAATPRRAPDSKPPGAFHLVRPLRAKAPILFASPHSGSYYPEGMQDLLRVPLMDLRRTEDAFVDDLFAAAPSLGAPLLHAAYGRAYVDLNRDSRELDPSMFEDGPPRPCHIGTARVEAGLGCLPRVAARGEPIYASRLRRRDGATRLDQIHDVYHARIEEELSKATALWGRAVLIDCHSMPSRQPGRRGLPDFVLGDRFGSSCDSQLTQAVERVLRGLGFSVARNQPYAGGYTTRRYGRPRVQRHALQIEINRALYMDEANVERSDGFERIRGGMTVLCNALIDFSASDDWG